MSEREGRTIEIDPKKLKPGIAKIVSVDDLQLAVCKSDDGKIRIFKVVEENEQRADA